MANDRKEVQLQIGGFYWKIAPMGANLCRIEKDGQVVLYYDPKLVESSDLASSLLRKLGREIGNELKVVLEGENPKLKIEVR